MDFDNLLNLFIKKTENIEIQLTNLSNIIIVAMELIELTELKDIEQKNAVIKLLTTLINYKSINISVNTKSKITEMIENKIIDNIIDTIVSATKGEFNINKKKKKIFKKCCFFSKNRKIIHLPRAKRAKKNNKIKIYKI